MKIIFAVGILISNLLVTFADNNRKHHNGNLRRKIQGERRSTSCTLVEGIALSEDPDDQSTPSEAMPWHCISKQDGETYLSIDGLPEDFFETHKGEIVSGQTVLTVYEPENQGVGEGESIPYTLAIAPGATFEIHNNGAQRDRRLVNYDGTSTVLVVRVIDSRGTVPSLTAPRLSDDVFGTFGDPHNLVSQYAACSGGKLKIVPGEGNNVVNGVVDISIPHDATGVSFFVVQNWVSTEFPGVVGKNLTDFTHVMYIMPRTVHMPYAGYAYYNNYLSIYKDLFASHLIVLVHEIGHNLNQRHSGEGTLEYADKTCMMGSSLFKDDAPLMCFNGAKSWFLGWYDDRKTEITPSLRRAWDGRLVGIDDYVNGQVNRENQYVIASIPSSDTTLYLMYNRQEGINSGVVDKGDTVTIVRQDSPTSISWFLTGLTEDDDPYRYEDWDGGESELVVKVCSRVNGQPDYARVLVYLDDGNSTFTCQVPPPDEYPRNPTATLLVNSYLDDYREKRNGAIGTGATQDLAFRNEDWNKMAYRFSQSDEDRIPARAVIISAVIWVYPDEYVRYREGAIFGYAVGHATGNPPDHESEDFYISNADKTSAKVRIKQDLPTWTAGRYQKLVNVGPIVEELVRRPDYLEGNSIEVFLIGEETGSYRRFNTSGFGRKGPTMNVKYSLKPIANAGSSYNSTAGDTVVFDASLSRGPITDFKWDFGDGTTVSSETTTVTHSYQVAGTYRVTLTVGNAIGNLDGDETIAHISEGKSVVEVEFQISHGTDDFVETDSGKIRALASKHQLWTTDFNKHAYRFVDVTIPRGATILEARLEMNARRRASTGQPMSGIVRGEAVGNSRSFKRGAYQISRAKKTDAHVNIQELPKWEVNKYNSLGDVTPVLQEIVNHEDYDSGNAIKLFLLNESSEGSRLVRTFESGAGAKLFVRYR